MQLFPFRATKFWLGNEFDCAFCNPIGFFWLKSRQRRTIKGTGSAYSIQPLVVKLSKREIVFAFFRLAVFTTASLSLIPTFSCFQNIYLDNYCWGKLVHFHHCFNSNRINLIADFYSNFYLLMLSNLSKGYFYSFRLVITTERRRSKIYFEWL